MIAIVTAEKTDIENNEMKKTKIIKRKIVRYENTQSNVTASEEVSDAYSLHDSDTTVGTETFFGYQ